MPLSAPPRPATVLRGGRLPAGRLLPALALPAAAFYLGFGWYYAARIRDGMTVGKQADPANVRVDAVSPGTVTLSPLPDAPAALRTDGVYGLVWDDGCGQVGALLAPDGAGVTRRLTGLRGHPPRAGVTARLTKDAFPDAATALGLPVEEVTVASAARALPAWQVAGPSSTWAILVHGKGATRLEMLRLMRTTTGLGLPSLDIGYRRDAESGGGLMRFGQDEWADLEAAVRYALDRGAREVVLLGCSSGAAVAAAFLERSALRGHVVAMVLDSPNLHLRAAVEHAARGERLPLVAIPVPSSLVRLAERVAGARFGVDFRGTDYLDSTDWLTVPTLVFHGSGDATVPPAVTERLAEAKPGLVRAALVEGAGHMESWNVGPRWYDTAVRRFLAPYADRARSE